MNLKAQRQRRLIVFGWWWHGGAGNGGRSLCHVDVLISHRYYNFFITKKKGYATLVILSLKLFELRI